MQTSLKSREQPDPRSFAARKGHLPQLSISDDNHHVTEAIGYMYGDDDSPSSPQSPARYSIRSDRSLDSDLGILGRKSSLPRKPLSDLKSSNGDWMSPLLNAQSQSPIPFRTAWGNKNGGSPVSPPSARDASPADTANTHFPLNDIDYESSPAAVAQELSNLQALRRMSMDLGAAGDPDLPTLNAAALPNAPSPSASEDDAARLFWVPARLHPELAPTEFKSFLESKAEQIKRRSGELSAFSSPGQSRSSSLSSADDGNDLRRKKSMLSRQIDSSAGYQDGADRLEKKRSQEPNGHPSDPNLQDLEELISGETGRLSLESKQEDGADDMILPSIPGSSLKRSTRTKYQRPSSRKGPVEPSTYAERAKRRAVTGSSTDISAATPTINIVPSESISGLSTDVSDLASTLRDPFSESQRTTMNYSRLSNRSPSPPPKDTPGLPTPTLEGENQSTDSKLSKKQRQALNAPILTPTPSKTVPQIIEPPPAEDHPVRTSSMGPPPSKAHPAQSEAPKQTDVPPPKDPRSKAGPSTRPLLPLKSSSATLSSNRPSPRPSNLPPQTQPSQSLDQPSPLPGNDTNTSNLSFIPTLTVDKRQEQRKKEEKKSGWSWRKGKEESDKEKEKSKAKAAKSQQIHDSTRLDVLQTSIDGGVKGRESLVLDRDSLRLDEERRKESQRKSSGNEKKEKESIFSSIFGGKKHKAEKEAQRKAQERLSPEPPYRELRPDVDYNWTRFSILEERTIYRMAHIKLANPRRALYSQVLLSNFMYSYLAKVQQMHPQMNLPTSAKQQRKQKEQQQMQQQQQPDEFTQYQRYQQQAQQPASSYDSADYQGSHSNYESDTNMYNFNYSREDPRPNGRVDQHSGESNSSLQPVGGEHYGSSGNGESHGSSGASSSHHNTQQQQQQHSQQPHAYSYSKRSQQQRQQNAPTHRYDDDDDDDDEDMW